MPVKLILGPITIESVDGNPLAEAIADLCRPLTVGELANYLKVSARTVTRMEKAGRLPRQKPRTLLGAIKHIHGVETP